MSPEIIKNAKTQYDVYETRNGEHILDALTALINCHRCEGGRLITVMLETDPDFCNSLENVGKQLAKIRRSLSDSGITLLIVSSGSPISRFRYIFTAQMFNITGLVSVTQRGEDHFLNVGLWRTMETTVQKEFYRLSVMKEKFLSHGRTLRTRSEGETAPDADVVWCASPRLADEPESALFHHKADNEGVFVAGLNSVAATLIFSIASFDDTEPLARLIHQLRRDRGDLIRIIVVESLPGIRANTELALMRLGANCIFEESATARHILSVVHGMSDTRYTGMVPTEFPDNFALSLKGDGIGFFAPAEFTRLVTDMMTRPYSIAESHGVLFTLTPREGHTLEDVMTKYTPIRRGDIATSANGTLIVYLFACHQADSLSALAKTFTVPVDTLFENVETEALDSQVLMTLEQKIPTRIDAVKQKISKREAAAIAALSPTAAPAEVPAEVPTEIRAEVSSEIADEVTSEITAAVQEEIPVTAESHPDDDEEPKQHVA